MMSLISVIIPNFNHAEYLKQRIDSVLNQSYKNFEVIILDDCSTDNSRTIIEQFRAHPKISHIIYNKKNSGSPFKQWIKGISLAKGQWIWIAESDDSADPVFLETLISHAAEYPTAGILYCNSKKEAYGDISPFKTSAEESNFDFNSNVWNYNHLMKGEESNALYLSKKNIILNASSALIQKKYISQLEELGKMKYYGDWFCYICIAARADIFYCSKPLNAFRRHSLSNIGRSALKNVKLDCFRILCLLLKQKNVDGAATINHFTHTYLGAELKREGLFYFFKTTMGYFLANPVVAIRVIRKIFQLKLGKKQ